MKVIATAAGLLFAGGLAAYLSGSAVRHSSLGGAALSAAASPAIPAEEAKKRELLALNAGLDSDADLADAYDALNSGYFGGRLPSIAVRWEPGLADVGPLVAPGFRLEGLTDGSLILLDPTLRDDRAQLDRVLCHEMVHVELRAVEAGHGSAFQARLRDLADAGAFTGIVASEEEKERLRSELSARAAALDRETTEIARLRERLARDRSDVEAEFASLNGRIDAANRRQAGWPAASEQDAAREHDGRLRTDIDRFNARAARYNEAIAEYDRLVARYNLMISYPDGLDRERLTARAGHLPAQMHRP